MFVGAHLKGALFNASHFDSVDFSEAVLEMAILIDAQMPGARFDRALLRYADCTALLAPRASFVAADVTGMNAHAADFTQADWQQSNPQAIQPVDTERLAAEQWRPASLGKSR